MKKDLSSFARMFEADSGMDRRDPFVSAWSDALMQSNSQRNRKFIATDVDNWLNTMMKEAAGADDSATVDVWLDGSNDLFCVSLTDTSGCSEFCVAPPRSPKTDKERLILSVINGGQDAYDALRKTVMKFKAGDAPAVTESDKREAEIVEEEMSDDQIDEISGKLDKAASLVANNQAAAYMIELAASRIRELKNG
jgi:hypothetical protein